MKKIYIALSLVIILSAIGTAFWQSKHHKTVTPKPAPTYKNVADPGNPDKIQHIIIFHGSLVPADEKIKVGAMVQWDNPYPGTQQIIFDSPSAATPNSGDIKQGASYKLKFSMAGTYTYHLAIDPNIKGKVTVQ